MSEYWSLPFPGILSLCDIGSTAYWTSIPSNDGHMYMLFFGISIRSDQIEPE